MKKKINWNMTANDYIKIIKKHIGVYDVIFDPIFSNSVDTSDLGFPPDGDDEDLSDDYDPQTFCFHDWKKYEGITDRYWYCTKCDLKRPLGNK